MEERHRYAAGAISRVIPGVIANGPMLVGYLQNSPNTSTEEITGKTVIMARLAEAIRAEHSSEIVEGVLTAISAQDFTGSGRTVDDILESALPVDVYLTARSIPGINFFFNPSNLVDELYSSFDNRMHAFLRDLFYEVPYEGRQYRKLMEKATKKPWWGRW